MNVFRHPATYLALCLLLFHAVSLRSFFWSDDWYFLNLTKDVPWWKLFQAFSFWQNDLSTPMYRPLSTQLFFGLFQNLFGLSAWPYYLFSLLILAGTVILVWYLWKLIFESSRAATIGTFIFAFSASQFTRVFYLSAFQEILMLFFVVLGIYLYFKKTDWTTTWLSLLCFVLALASKESAVVFPLILFIFSKIKSVKKLSHLVPFIAVLAAYLPLRLLVLGTEAVGGQAYVWNFSPFRAIHTFSWYSIWNLGAPEMLLDYVSSGLRILPQYFTAFPIWGWWLLILLLITIATWIFVFWRAKVWRNKYFWLIIAGYAVSLLPIIFLPGHKYVLGQSMTLLMLSGLVSFISTRQTIRWSQIMLGIFLLLNIVSLRLYHQAHYSIHRPQIARQVSEYFNQNYPSLNDDTVVVFTNDELAPVATWGVSRQVSQAINFNHMLSIMYPNHPQPIMVYEDDPESIKNLPDNILEIPSSQFLKTSTLF